LVFTLDAGRQASSVTLNGSTQGTFTQEGDRVSLQLPEELVVQAGQSLRVEIET